MWKDIASKGSAHYSIMHRANDGKTSMDALREMFPNAKADRLNFVLFSTSGVHGTYNTIEEAEKSLKREIDEDGDEYFGSVTFLIIHPRLVSLRYGECEPKNQEDIDFLKSLRKSSMSAVQKIGF